MADLKLGTAVGGYLVLHTNNFNIYSPTLVGTGASGTWSIAIAGEAGSVRNALTFNNSGSGVASGTTFDGSTARIISYNTIGAQPLLTNPVTGTGTPGRIPKFNATSGLADSSIYTSGTNVGIGNTPETKLHVFGGNLAVNGTLSTYATNGAINLSYAGGVGAISVAQDSAGTNADIAFSVGNNAEKMRILANGNVGLSTALPYSRLDVVGTSTATSLNANSLSTVAFRTAGHVQMAIATESASPYATSFQGKHATADGTAYPLSLNPLGGNVGIGTLTPGYKLEIKSTAGNYNTIFSDGTRDVGVFLDAVGGWVGTRTNHQLNFMTNNSNPQVTLLTTGLFGIGTQTPNAMLHINTTQSGKTTLGNSRVLILANSNGAANELQEIGFGYKSTTYQPVVIGHRVTNQAGQSIGDFYVATRLANTDTAPLERFTIVANGNTGVNTINPTTKFQISALNSEYAHSTSAFSIQKNEEQYGLFMGLSSSGNGWLQTGYITDSYQYNLILQPNAGNVGIHTTSPQAKLHVDGSIYASGSISTGSANMSYSENTDVDTTSEVVVSKPVGSYTAAFFNYVITNGTNARCGIISAVWNGSTIRFSEVTSNEIGTVYPFVILTVELNGGNVELKATVTSNNWSVKATTTLI